MNFQIFQPVLTAAQRREVNSVGWGGVAWGSAYMNVTSCLGEDNAVDAARRAFEAGLYSHKWTVEAPDVEATFPITNGVRRQESIRWVDERAQSGSVGDVALTFDGEVWRMWVCVSYGWHELDAEEVREFRALHAKLVVQQALARAAR